MTSSSWLRRAAAALFLFATVLPGTAIAQSSTWRVEPSGRATSMVTLNWPAAQGAERVAPARITVDYGQPHLRGRDVLTLIPLNEQWRLGANTATTLTTGLDIMLGGTLIPKGTYSLYTLRTDAGYKLIINKQTGQNGMSYDKAQDFARVDLRSRTLPYSLESLQITLAPSTGGPSGVLRIIWGNVELETNWSVKQ